MHTKNETQIVFPIGRGAKAKSNFERIGPGPHLATKDQPVRRATGVAVVDQQRAETVYFRAGARRNTGPRRSGANR